MKRLLLDRAFADMRANRRHEAASGLVLKRRYQMQAFPDQIQENVPPNNQIPMEVRVPISPWRPWFAAEQEHQSKETWRPWSMTQQDGQEHQSKETWRRWSAAGQEHQSKETWRPWSVEQDDRESTTNEPWRPWFAARQGHQSKGTWRPWSAAEKDNQEHQSNETWRPWSVDEQDDQENSTSAPTNGAQSPSFEPLSPGQWSDHNHYDYEPSDLHLSRSYSPEEDANSNEMETDTAHQQSEPIELVDEAVNTNDPESDTTSTSEPVEAAYTIDPDDEVSPSNPVDDKNEDDRSSHPMEVGAVSQPVDRPCHDVMRECKIAKQLKEKTLPRRQTRQTTRKADRVAASKAPVAAKRSRFVPAASPMVDRGAFEQVFGRFAWWQDVKGYRPDDPGKYKVSDKVLSRLSKKIEEWGGQMPTRSEKRKRGLPIDVVDALSKAYENKLNEFFETYYAKSDKKGDSDSVRVTVMQKDYANFVSQLDRERYPYPSVFFTIFKPLRSYWRRTHKVTLKSGSRIEYDKNLKFRVYYPMKGKIGNRSRS